MIIPAFQSFVPFSGIMAAAGGAAILGTPAALWDGANTTHNYNYTLVAGANGLVVIGYADSGETFTSCEWDPIGFSPQAMTALTTRFNGNTRCQMFILFNPIPGTGAGTIRLVASAAQPMGVVAISIGGWTGTAPVQNGQSGVSTNPGAFNLTSVVPNSLVIHGICAGLGTPTVSIGFSASETLLVNTDLSGLNPGMLQMGASWLQSSAGGTVTLDASTSVGNDISVRWADVAAAFPLG